MYQKTTRFLLKTTQGCWGKLLAAPKLGSKTVPPASFGLPRAPSAHKAEHHANWQRKNIKRGHIHFHRTSKNAESIAERQLINEHYNRVSLSVKFGRDFKSLIESKCSHPQRGVAKLLSHPRQGSLPTSEMVRQSLHILSKHPSLVLVLEMIIFRLPPDSSSNT